MNMCWRIGLSSVAMFCGTNKGPRWPTFSDFFFYRLISFIEILQASLETMIKLAEGIVSSDIAAGERVWWPQPGASTKDFSSDVVSRTLGSTANTFAKQFQLIRRELCERDVTGGESLRSIAPWLTGSVKVFVCFPGRPPPVDGCSTHRTAERGEESSES